MDDVVCHVLVAGAVALSFACAGGACGTAWDRCGCYCRSAVVFTEQLFFVCGIGSSFLWGHICLPMCRWEMCGILSGNYLIPQYWMQPAGGVVWGKCAGRVFGGNEFAVLFCGGGVVWLLWVLGGRHNMFCFVCTKDTMGGESEILKY